jgi:hypothetical protein
MLHRNVVWPSVLAFISASFLLATPAQSASPVNVVHVGTKYSLRNAEGRAIRFSDDGKSLVVAGQFKGKPARPVAMALDTSGANLWSSEASADFQNDRSCQTTAVAFDPNGSAIIAGPCLDEFQRFGFVRFMRSGELDPTFKTPWTGIEGEPEQKGRVVHTPSEANYYLDQIAVPYAVDVKGSAAEWRIVAAGYSGADRDSRLTVAQMHPNGELDTTFGNDQPGTGFFTSDLTSIKAAEKNTARGATGLLVDGKNLLVCGNMLLGGRWQAFVIRLADDGTIDTSFNRGAGIVLLPFGPDVEAKAFSICWSGPDKERAYIGAYSRRKGMKEGWRLSAACIAADGQPYNAFGGRNSTIAPSASTYDASVTDPVNGPQIGVLADETVILVGQVSTTAGPAIGIVSLGPTAAWAAERPGIPTGVAISRDAAQLIAVSATTPSGGMTVEFYSPNGGVRQARR